MLKFLNAFILLSIVSSSLNSFAIAGDQTVSPLKKHCDKVYSDSFNYFETTKKEWNDYFSAAMKKQIAALEEYKTLMNPEVPYAITRCEQGDSRFCKVAESEIPDAYNFLKGAKNYFNEAHVQWARVFVNPDNKKTVVLCTIFNSEDYFSEYALCSYLDKKTGIIYGKTVSSALNNLSLLSENYSTRDIQEKTKMMQTLFNYSSADLARFQILSENLVCSEVLNLKRTQ